jgi:hypothetical protein
MPASEDWMKNVHQIGAASFILCRCPFFATKSRQDEIADSIEKCIVIHAK